MSHKIDLGCHRIHSGAREEEAARRGRMLVIRAATSAGMDTMGCRVSEYDDLIEQAAAQFAGCIISPTPEREAAFGRFIGEALRLRYGRLWLSRDDAIDLWWDVVETLRRTLKAGTLPGQLGNDPAAIEHVLDVEIRTMSRAQIEQMVDYCLAVFRLSRGHLGRHRRQHH
jgi:hypothetical protein